MNNLAAYLLAVPTWVSDSFKYIRIVLISLTILFAIVLIVSVLMQPANQQGLGAISGETDTYFSKNKGRSREGRLKMLSIVSSLVIFGCILLFFITLAIDQSVL